MNILFDTQLKLHGSVDQVWEALTSADLRPKWQLGVSKAKLISGSPGYRGAQTRLSLRDIDEEVTEHVHRSRPLERIQTQFKLGDCSYQQILHLIKLDDETTQLTYHCKQMPNSGWRRILNIRPTVPTCVQPDIYQSLEDYLNNSTVSH